MKNYPTCWPRVKFEDLRQKKTLENKLNEPSPPKNQIQFLNNGKEDIHQYAFNEERA